MKRLISLVAVVIAVLMLVACQDMSVSSFDGDDLGVVTSDETKEESPDTTQSDEEADTEASSSDVSDTTENETGPVQIPIQQNTDPNIEAYDENVTLFLPEIEPDKTIHINSEQIKKLSVNKTGLAYKVGDVWVAVSRGTFDSRPVLYDETSDEIIELIDPENFPEWVVGSGSTLILQDRYLFEWLVYDDSTVKLKRIDTKTKELKFLRSEEDALPSSVYLSKIDDERFISYYRLRDPEGAEVDMYSVCEIYDIDGNHIEIIREGFIEDIGGGYYYDAFASRDGSIYGLCKMITSDNVQWYLRQFTIDGELVDTVPLNNFSYMLGNGGVEKFDIVGDYIVTRDGLGTTCYVYKLGEGNDELVMKGVNNMEYVTVDDLIVCAIIKDENGNALSEGTLYVLNTASGEITKVTYPLDDGIDSFDLTFRTTGSGDLHLSYFDYEETQYIISKELIS